MKNQRIERLIAGCFLAILMAAAWLDNSSETAAQMRARTPWMAWLALRGPASDASKPPAFYLLAYRWDERVLHVIRMPETPAALKAYTASLRRSPGQPADAAAPAAERALVQFYGTQIKDWVSPRLSLRWTSGLADPGSPEQVKAWMLSWPRTFRFWLALPGVLEELRRRGNPEPSAYDATVLARRRSGWKRRTSACMRCRRNGTEPFSSPG